MPPNLRSRQILPPKQKSSSPRRTPNKSASASKLSKKTQSSLSSSSIEPSTPNPIHEASAPSQEPSPDSLLPPQSVSGPISGPRRSSRLSGKSNSGSEDKIVSPNTRERRCRGVSRMGPLSASGKCDNSAEPKRGEEAAALGMGSMGFEVIRVSDSESDSDDEKKGENMMHVQGGVGSESGKSGSKRKFSDRETPDGVGFLSLGLGLGNKIAKKIVGNSAGSDELVGSVTSPGVVTDNDQEGGGNKSFVYLRRKFSRGEKGKGKLVSEDLHSEVAELGSVLGAIDNKGKGKLLYDVDDDDHPLEEHQYIDLKLKLGIDGMNPSPPDQLKLTLNQSTPVLLDDANSTAAASASVNPSAFIQNGNMQPPPADNPQDTPSDSNRYREHRFKQFKRIAKETASRFACVTTVTTLPLESDDEGEELPDAAAENLEEWPGPFSTAMKIIRDREKTNASAPAQQMSSKKSGSTPVLWTPRTESGPRKKCVAPLLQDLCLKILAKNGDAIPSLEYVPDDLRNKLSRMISDSRKMSGHFLDILFQGSPSEIRVPDCSWVTEEQFAKSCQSCDTANLTVLELNQCGRCMADYTLKETLATKGLPFVTTISLKGACRLSDNGLTELVHAAPSLRSINLSQCSLLTDVGISAIAESLGSVLRELYLDDCQTLNTTLILPALQKMNHLEVLSLAGIPSVSNAFVKELVKSNGQGLKGLVLADCTKLTDKSLKVIGETCSSLCALDLQNICKLSDAGIGYITNGCPAMQKLKLCRQTFSDETIAAFVETRGEFLRELSLNSVFKVGAQTAISIARNCKNLQCLDVSWCRNLVDEHFGLIADGCLSLLVMKAFGCQMTNVFLNGHSNPNLNVIGAKLSPILGHMRLDDLLPAL